MEKYGTKQTHRRVQEYVKYVEKNDSLWLIMVRAWKNQQNVQSQR